MPQETNLNVSPYFDDFDSEKDYYKVLFKPGYPVQARELNNVQSSFQNQIERFGSHIFKEGSVVIPGQLKYESPLYAVQIESQFNGVPIEFYFDNLLGAKIRGASSGVTAEIVYLLNAEDSEKGNYTIYVKYIQSGGENFDVGVFSSGETLILDTPVSYSNITIQPGQGFCNTLSEGAILEGSAVSVAAGVYFVRGFFAKNRSQTILLDQYGVNPSYKVGFDVLETIVNSDQDSDLVDNAQGFSNYAAPGADRFKLELVLAKKDINDNNTESFVEILRVENGVPQFFNENSQYNLIRDELARRTYDESGNYFVKPFTLFVRDSLNDRVLNDGVFFNTQKTIQGNTPSEDLMVYQIGPGKAYVNGYDVETIAPKLLDVPKARTTERVEDQYIEYNAGSLVVLNNGYGSPTIGLGTDAVVSLMDSRIGESNYVASGTTIGYARVYDFVPESDYVDNQSRLNLRLFDIQTITKIGLTTSFSDGLSLPCFIEGKKSKASGYLKIAATSTDLELTLYQTTGNFLENEQIIVNGEDDGRLITSVTDYSISDIKSVYSLVGVSTFNADLILSRKSYIAPPGTEFKIDNGVVSAGIENTFTNIINVGDIVSYASTTFIGDPIYNKVTSVSAGGTTFTVTGITTVSGVCNGILPSGSFNVNNILKLSSSISDQNKSLLTNLTDTNISSLNLEGNEVLQRKTFTVSSFSGGSLSITIDPADTDLYFSSFDEDRYIITYFDGSTEPMRSDKFNLDVTGKTLTFNGLTKDSGSDTRVIATVRNLKANSKSKKLNKVSSIIISNSSQTSSGIGTTTLNDGLTYSNVYGVRVQDKEISLNLPDVVRVIAVYESNGSSDPVLPQLQITGNPNGNGRYVVGEQIEGKNSGSIAIITSKIDSDKIEYVYLNTFQFETGEVIVGQESTEQSIISGKIISDKNITQNFNFDDGQRDTYYDFSRIVRKNNVETPKKRLKIIFQNYTIDSSDTGEFITANSYSAENFKYNVPYYNRIRLTDCIDIRPRVAPYTLSSKSPFEFDSRNFASDGQYSDYILVPGERLLLSYDYYVGRIDRVFLNSDGTFEVVQGIPSSNPKPPALKSNSLDIATVGIPPYVYDVKNIIVDMSKHKRYRMSDISLLEDRIERVEKFTTLSMLESKTENFNIKDAETGLDRFKCGFFVDNFSTHEYHELQNPSFKSAIDTTTNTLRPLHYTTLLDLQLGSEVISGVGTEYYPNRDHSYVSDLGSPNIRKTGDLITLNYNNVLYFEQPYASKTESVTPFLVRYWQGSITLNPPIDTWVDEKKVTTNSFNEITNTIERADQNFTVTENVVVNNEVWVNPPSPQTGVDSFDWIQNARNIIATNPARRAGLQVSIINADRQGAVFGQWNNQFAVERDSIRISLERGRLNPTNIDLIRSLVPPDVADQYITQLQSPSGLRAIGLMFTPGVGGTISEDREVTTTTQTTSNISTIVIPPEITENTTTTESISNYTEVVRYLRSRNIEFDAKGLRPRTRFYSFFEGIDVSNYVIPKLLEIEMVSGKFQIGETVESDPFFTTNKIKFRVCKPNHRTGPFDGSNPPEIESPAPSIDLTTDTPLQTLSETTFVPDVFKLNPYTQQSFEENYTESSTVLNVDTRALQLPSEVDYYGSISSNMRIIGKTSGAIAVIKPVRLISDNQGRLIGSLFVPDPNVTGNPQWINGENTLTLIDTPALNNLDQVFDEFIPNTRINESSADAEFSSSAISNVTETNILTTRNVTILSAYNVNTTTITNTTTNTTTVSQTQSGGGEQVRIWQTNDPLAQSFYVTDSTGIFLTSVEVYFETKDDSIPVTLQIRPMIAGVPSNVVVPFSEVTLSPDEVNLSVDGSTPTVFKFPSPVYLGGPRQLESRSTPIGSEQTSQFAIVLLSGSPQYRVFVSELGQNDIQTGIKLSAQPTLGSLFKSQNGTTWSPSQLEDLKYKIYRADFVSEGLVRFFNPKLDIGNKKVTVTGSNQLTPLSKRITVGLGSTGYDSTNLIPGVTLTQGSASGKLIGVGGSVITTFVTNAGTGYTPASGSYTFTGVELETETGSGTGAIADIGVVNSGITTVTITSGGFGYKVGDSLIIPEKEFGLNVGFGGKLTVNQISSENTSFILDNVQGNFASGISTIYYVNSSGTEVSTGATISSVIPDAYYDGLHMKIAHMNHGMHSSQNYVKFEEVRPSHSEPNSTTVSAVSSSQLSIPLVSTTGFDIFEGVSVSASNPGYAIIGNEVIEYTSSGGNTLTVTQRGVDGSEIQSYLSGSAVYKYEFNGVSLRRINKVHNFAEVNQTNHPISLNSYYIKIDNSDTDFEGVGIGSDRTNDLYFTETARMGRTGSTISNNIQYEAITPNIASIIPAKTNLSSRIRTFSGTSVGGNEVSFVDDGFTSISLDSTTYFAAPKVICSYENEQRFITETPGNKSFTMEFLMNTTDSRVSPVIDNIQTSVVLTSNLLNSPSGLNENSNYANDDSVRSLYDDQHDAIYISKPVKLKIPANSIKVILSASHNTTNDIRVLYRLYRDDAPEISGNYEFFPGYSNYQVDGQGIKRVIDSSKNDGSSDSKVNISSDRSFKEYEYSVDDLPDFNAFSIKIVMAGSNQAQPPLVKDLRAIATIKPRV